jgi:hypothetical protein
LKPDDAMRAVEGLPGFAKAFYAMLDRGGSSRLDYFYARYIQRTREMWERFEDVRTLGEYIDVAPIERPEPNRRGEYPFAYPSRLTGTVVPKGEQAVNYSVSDLWVVREADLVVSGIDAVNGAIGVAGSDVDGMVMSDEFFAYRVKQPSAVSTVYLSLLLRSQPARELLEGMSTGTSNRTRLKRADQLLDLPIPPLPPISEQRRIAKQFTDAVAAREGAEAMQQTAEDHAGGAWLADDTAPSVVPDRT